jgi:crotonobetainyl-CoA:carnitine CoA-transferase CaiB-like acyl-CoA transferase
MVTALERRRVTGKGSYLDLSMYESMVHLLGELTVEASHRGRAPERSGNRVQQFAPQGIYPCLGDNQWVALTIQNDAQWAALRAEVGHSELQSSTLDSLEARKECHRHIDVLIGEWTRSQEKNSVAARLQSLGIPAGPVQDVDDLPLDPQLSQRQFFQLQTHREPILGYRAHPHMAVTARAEGFLRTWPKETKGDGGDNRRVLRRWLGLDAADVRKLEKGGALLPPRRAPFVNIAEVPATGGEVDPCFAQRLGLTDRPRRGD